jgi:acetyl esterase/lipase
MPIETIAGEPFNIRFDGPAEALALVDAIEGLDGYPLWHATRAELLSRLGRRDAADAIDRLSSRPDLGVLCYAVISMGEYTHGGSKKNLLGDNPDPVLVESLSNEKQVSKETPPCFIWHTWEDKAVRLENSLMFANALQKAGVPFDLHVYEKGPHGIGLSQGKNGVAPDDVHPWGKDLVFWLKVHGFAR